MPSLFSVTNFFLPFLVVQGSQRSGRPVSAVISSSVSSSLVLQVVVFPPTGSSYQRLSASPVSSVLRLTNRQPFPLPACRFDSPPTRHNPAPKKDLRPKPCPLTPCDYLVIFLSVWHKICSYTAHNSPKPSPLLCPAFRMLAENPRPLVS